MTQSPTPDNSLAPMDSEKPKPVPETLRRLWKSDGPELELTPGEYVDLLSIARVKHRKLAGSDKEDAARRRVFYLASLAHGMSDDDEMADVLFQYVYLLDFIHEELWNVENQLRAMDGEIHWQDPAEKTIPRNWSTLLWHRLPDSFTDKLGEYVDLARQVYVLNTERSEIKKEIDERFGAEPEVKHYSAF